MKAKTAIYWTTTALIALETFVGGIMDLTRGRTSVTSGPTVAEVVTGLGYPLYILIILGIAKFPAAITLVAPGFLRLKEWAYAGLCFELTGAIASHAFAGQSREMIAPSILLTFALLSWALRPSNRILGATLFSKNLSSSQLADMR